MVSWPLSLARWRSGVDPIRARDLNVFSEALETLSRRTFDVRSFGASTASSDNRIAIQAAIAAAGAAGGGTVVISEIYKVNSSGGSVGFGGAKPYGLLIADDNITLEGGGGLDFTGLHAILGDEYHGFAVGRPIGLTNRIGLEPVDALSGAYAKGVRTLTFLTAGVAAAKYQAGDWIYIRTGNVIVATTSVSDSERNQVVAVDGGANTITLRWPTSKPFAQEYYIAGTSGISSTVVTANAVPYGVKNLSRPVNWIVKRPTFRGLTLLADSSYVLFTMFHPIGMRIEDCEATLDGGLFQGAGRGGRVLRNRVHIDPPGREGQVHWSASDTNTVDLAIEDNDFSSSGSGWLHLREGSAQVAVRRNRLVQANDSVDFSTGLGYPTIDVDFRAYDHDIADNEIIGTGLSNAAIRVGAACNGGGKVRGNTIDAITGATAVSIGADNWHITGDNKTTGKAVRRSMGMTQAGAQANVGIAPTEPVTLPGRWLTPTEPTVTLGVIPPESAIQSVRYIVDTAFNSDGTDQVRVGYDGTATTMQSWAALTDVSTASPAPVTPNAGLNQPYTTAQRTAKAYYVAGGSAPTTGKVLVLLTYTPAQFRP